MRLRILIVSLFISSTIAAQNNVVDTARKPCITSIGKPFGNISSSKIDGKGGKIKSLDGKLEIIFPTDALDHETTISIQPINNGLTENDDGAYRLEPSGITFKKSIQLIFHYDDNGISKSIATQDSTGRWIGLAITETDTITKTVSGYVQHFSDWALFNHYDLLPVKATIYVNGSQLFEIRHLSPEAEKAHGGAIQFGVPLVTEKVVVDKWTVNGIVNGSAETGTIAESSRRWGIYVAPAQIPSQNPVAVTAYFSGTYFTLEGNRYKKFSLTSSILIKDFGYRFTYIHKNFAGCFHYVDSSSCIIRFDSKSATISEITNYKPWSDWDPCTKCNHQYTNKETYKANVEIWGMQTFKVVPATKEKPMAEVYVALLPALGNTPAAEQQCPKMPKVVMPSMPLPADPKYIHFETDGNDIIVHYLGVSGKNIISKKVKNEETIIRVTKL